MLIHNLFLHIVFTLLIQISKSKPLQDENFVHSYHKPLADNIDQNLKYIETGNVKTKPLDYDDVQTTPDPLLTTEILTTSLLDMKLDEEMDDVNSNSEEERSANSISPLNDHDPNHKLLSVEEHENHMVFDEKHEILAKKPIPQILKAPNSPPTILPQTASIPKPTQPEPPTTPLINQESKNSKKQLEDKNEMKQKSITTTEKPKQYQAVDEKLKQHQTIDEKAKQHQTVDEKPLNHLDHVAEMLDHQVRDEMDENRQGFDGKSRVTQGGLIYGGQIPEIGAIGATTPQPIEKTTAKPTESHSMLDRLYQAVLCTRGDCTDVFVPTVEAPNPRELKEMTIIRRVRHDQEIIEVECKCGGKKKKTN